MLAYGDVVDAGSIGRRSTFADIGQTLAAYFDLPELDYGESFLAA